MARQRQGYDRIALCAPVTVTDSNSVRELAAVIGGKVEILVNNSYHLRLGSLLDRFDVNTAREEMDVHYPGLMRLAGNFGPALACRDASIRCKACLKKPASKACRPTLRSNSAIRNRASASLSSGRGDDALAPAPPAR